MKIAIMQPYFFPYIGYFQLINAVDKFVFYDDVNFIKHGWINRNNILVNNQKHLFSLPIKKISSFKKINETKINENIFNKEKVKLLKTIDQSYKKAPNFYEIKSIITSVFNIESNYISEFAKKSIVEILKFLEIETKIVLSSSIYKNDKLSATDRLIDVCKKEKAETYINPIGGKELYSKMNFKKQGIKLCFLKSYDTIYKQYDKPFISGLSIIDVLMFNSKEDVKNLLLKFQTL